LSYSPSKQWLSSERKVRFGDVDSAGVIHFYHLFRWCHEFWEESLEVYGIYPLDIFPVSVFEKTTRIVLPIVSCEAEFISPIRVGDVVNLILTAKEINSGRFEIITNFYKSSNLVAKGIIVHQAVDIETNKSCNLPENIQEWIRKSS